MLESGILKNRTSNLSDSCKLGDWNSSNKMEESQKEVWGDLKKDKLIRNDKLEVWTNAWGFKS